MLAAAMSTALLAVCYHVQIRRVDSGIMTGVVTPSANLLHAKE